MKNIHTLIFVFIQITIFGQITVDIHPNFKHTVGGLDTFNRKQKIRIRADQIEN